MLFSSSFLADNIDFDENFEYETDQQRLKRKSDRHYAVVVAIDDTKPTSINSYKRFGIMPCIDDNTSVEKSMRPYLGLSDTEKYNTNKEKKPKIEELIKTLQTMMDNDDCDSTKNQGYNKKQPEKNDNANDDVSPEIQNNETMNDDDCSDNNKPSDKMNDDEDTDDDNDPGSNVKNKSQDDVNDFAPTKNNNNQKIKSKSRKCQSGTGSTKSGSRTNPYNNNCNADVDDEGDESNDEAYQRTCNEPRSQGSKKKKQKQSTENRRNSSNQQGNDFENQPGERKSSKGKGNPNYRQQPSDSSDIDNNPGTINDDDSDYSVKNTAVQPNIQRDQFDDDPDYVEETQNGDSDDYAPNTSKKQGNKYSNKSSSTSGSQNPTKVCLGSRYKCSQPKICSTPIKNAETPSNSGKRSQHSADGPFDDNDNTGEYNDRLSPTPSSSKRSKSGSQKSKIGQRSKSINKVLPVAQANYDSVDIYGGSGEANYDDDENIHDDFKTDHEPIPQYPSSSVQQQHNNQLFNQPKRKTPNRYNYDESGDEYDEEPTTQSPPKFNTTTQFISQNNDGQNMNRPLRLKKTNKQPLASLDDKDHKDDEKDSLNNGGPDNDKRNHTPSKSGSHSSDCSLRDNLKKLEKGLKDAFGVQCKCKKPPSNNSGGQNKRKKYGGKGGGNQTSENNCSGEARQRRQRGAIYFHDLISPHNDLAKPHQIKDSALPVTNPKETSSLIKIIESYKSLLKE